MQACKKRHCTRHCKLYWQRRSPISQPHLRLDSTPYSTYHARAQATCIPPVSQTRHQPCRVPPCQHAHQRPWLVASYPTYRSLSVTRSYRAPARGGQCLMRGAFPTDASLQICSSMRTPWCVGAAFTTAVCCVHILPLMQSYGVSRCVHCVGHSRQLCTSGLMRSSTDTTGIDH